MLRYIVLPHISSCEIFEYVSYYLSVVKFHGKEVVGGIAAIAGMTANDLGKVEPSEANAKYILLYYSNREPSISSMEDQKFISFFEKRDRQYEIILTQNSEIIRQNGEILQRVLKYIDDNNSK